MQRVVRFLIPLLILAVLVLAAALLLYRTSTRALEERVERAVITTLQRETPEQFLVTGRLDVTATVQVRSTRVFLPNILDLDIGSAEARVRVPGRVSYGIDTSQLEESDVQFHRDGSVEIRLPELQIYAVDPQLAHLEIQSSSGWFRPSNGEQRVTQEALAHLREGLERQGEAHLRDNVQPRVNSANALRQLLEPVLLAAGIENPDIRIIGGAELEEPLLEPAD